MSRMVDKTQYIGTQKMNNRGLNVRCIDYRSYRDCDFQFDIDGLICTGYSYGQFMKGGISHPLHNKFSNRKIFEKEPEFNKTKKRHTEKKNTDSRTTKKTEITKKLKSYLGEVNANHDGHTMEVIDMDSTGCLTVMFDNDPEKVRYGIAPSNFISGAVETFDKTWAGRIGRRIMSNCGVMMTVIAYRNAKDIDVLFDSGEIARHKQWGAFTRGEIGRKPRNM